MAQPKGTKTRVKKPQDPTPLKQIEFVCRVTGKSFSSYENALPLSNEGWEELSDKQKYLIANGAELKEVL